MFIFLELEPLSPDMKSKLLDFEDMKQEETNLKPTFLPPPQLPEIVLTNNLDDMSKEKKKSDYKRAPRMNTFVGFLRLANYINASCVIFGVIASILMKEDEHSKPKEDEHSKPLSEVRDLFLSPKQLHSNVESFQLFLRQILTWKTSMMVFATLFMLHQVSGKMLSSLSPEMIEIQ